MFLGRKGNATTIDVQRGLTTQRDKWGNDGADVLALKGADLHKIPENIVQSARERKSLAKVVQKMMVTVLKARFDAEAAQAFVVIDRGSEMGDCMEFEPDDCGSEVDAHGCMEASFCIDVHDHDLFRNDQVVHDECALVQDLRVSDGHALQDDGFVGTHPHDSLDDVSFSFSCTDLDDDFDGETMLLSGIG